MYGRGEMMGSVQKKQNVNGPSIACSVNKRCMGYLQCNEALSNTIGWKENVYGLAACGV
jgi:hypothetical protein